MKRKNGKIPSAKKGAKKPATNVKVIFTIIILKSGRDVHEYI